MSDKAFDMGHDDCPSVVAAMQKLKDEFAAMTKPSGDPPPRCLDCGKIESGHKGWFGAECFCGVTMETKVGHSTGGQPHE